MDDLHDAIQDAQYIGELANPLPRPTKPLVLPPLSDAVPFRTHLLRENPAAMEFETILMEPLGFYLFDKALRSGSGCQGLTLIKATEEFGVMATVHARTIKASEICQSFLKPAMAAAAAHASSTSVTTASGSSPTTASTSVSPSQGRSSDRKEESTVSVDSVDVDVSRQAKTHFQGRMHALLRRRSPEVQARATHDYQQFKARTSIGVAGEVVESIVRRINEAKARDLDEESSKASDEHVPNTLFQRLADAVLEGLRVEYYEGFINSTWFAQYLQFKLMERVTPGPADFSLFRILGRGGFGAVKGCKKCDTGKLYAMKTLSKKRLKAKGSVELCLNERRIMSLISSPFVVSMIYAFQTPEEVHLILDIMTGGDLSFHLAKSGVFSEERARFYAAEILLGLEHLHSLNIVYRDLKPENVLMDEFGHVRLSDMGLATEYHPGLHGRCGTRGYWAPEMLIKTDTGRSQPYNFVVDWWSFGCVLYEFRVGKCPFRSAAAKALDEDRHVSMDLATLSLEIEYPMEVFSPELASLCRGLLCRDPARRLGARGVAEVKQHPWFASIDWGMMTTGQIEPPFVPEHNVNAASQEAIGDFDDATSATLTERDQTAYANWAFVNRQAFQQEIVDFLSWEDRAGPIRPTNANAGCCTIQ